jgi:hypothetical protein
MKTKLLSSILILLTLFIGCDEDELPKNTPSCIVEKINTLKSEDVKDPPSSVWQYDYNGMTVYFIPQYCCDFPSQLYDSSCNLICNPDGGISGSGDGNCTDFFSERTNEKLIWQDPRK